MATGLNEAHNGRLVEAIDQLSCQPTTLQSHRESVKRLLKVVGTDEASITDAVRLITGSQMFSPTQHFREWKVLIDVLRQLIPLMTPEAANRLTEALLVATSDVTIDFSGHSMEAVRTIKFAAQEVLDPRKGLITTVHSAKMTRQFSHVVKAYRGNVTAFLLDSSFQKHVDRIAIASHTLSVRGWSKRVFIPLCDMDLQRRTLGWIGSESSAIAVKRMQHWWLQLVKTLCRMSWGLYRLAAFARQEEVTRMITESVCDVLENILNYDDVTGLSSQREALTIFRLLQTHALATLSSERTSERCREEQGLLHKQRDFYSSDAPLSSPFWLRLTDQFFSLIIRGLVQPSLMFSRLDKASQRLSVRNLRKPESFVKLLGQLYSLTQVQNASLKDSEKSSLCQTLMGYVSQTSKELPLMHSIFTTLLFVTYHFKESKTEQLSKYIQDLQRRTQGYNKMQMSLLQLLQKNGTMDRFLAFLPLFLAFSFADMHVDAFASAMAQASISPPAPIQIADSQLSSQRLTLSASREAPHQADGPSQDTTNKEGRSTGLLQKSGSSSQVDENSFTEKLRRSGDIPAQGTARGLQQGAKIEKSGFDGTLRDLQGGLPPQRIINELPIKLKYECLQRLEYLLTGIKASNKIDICVPTTCLFSFPLLSPIKDVPKERIPEAISEALIKSSASAVTFPKADCRLERVPGWWTHEIAARLLLSAPNSLRTYLIHAALQNISRDAHLESLVTLLDIRLLAHMKKIGYLRQLLHDVLLAYQRRLVEEEKRGEWSIEQFPIVGERRRCLQACESLLLGCTVMMHEIVPVKLIEGNNMSPLGYPTNVNIASPQEPLFSLGTFATKVFVYGQSLVRRLEETYGSRRGRTTNSKEVLLQNCRAMHASLFGSLWVPTGLGFIPTEAEGIFLRRMTERARRETEDMAGHSDGFLFEGVLPVDERLAVGLVSRDFRATASVLRHAREVGIQQLVEKAISGDATLATDEKRVLSYYFSANGKPMRPMFLAAVWYALWANPLKRVVKQAYEESGNDESESAVFRRDFPLAKALFTERLLSVVRGICSRLSYLQFVEAISILVGFAVDAMAAFSVAEKEQIEDFLLPFRFSQSQLRWTESSLFLRCGAALLHCFAHFDIAPYEHILLYSFERLADNTVQRTIATSILEEFLCHSISSQLLSICDRTKELPMFVEFSSRPSTAVMSLLRCGKIFDIGLELACKAVGKSLPPPTTKADFWCSSYLDKGCNQQQKNADEGVALEVRRVAIIACRGLRRVLALHNCPSTQLKDILRRWLSQSQAPDPALLEAAVGYLEGMAMVPLSDLNIELHHISPFSFPLVLSEPMISMLLKSTETDPEELAKNGAAGLSPELFSMKYLAGLLSVVQDCLQRLQGGSAEIGQLNYLSSTLPPRKMSHVRTVFEHLEREYGNYFAGRLGLVQIEVMLHPAGIQNITNGLVDAVVANSVTLCRVNGPTDYEHVYRPLGDGVMSAAKFIATDVDALAYLLASLPSVYHKALAVAVEKRVIDVVGQALEDTQFSDWASANNSGSSGRVYSFLDPIEDSPVLSQPPPLGCLLGMLHAFADYAGRQGLEVIESVTEAVAKVTSQDLRMASAGEVSKCFFASSFCIRCLCPFLTSLELGDLSISLLGTVFRSFFASLDESLSRTASETSDILNSHVDFSMTKRKFDDVDIAQLPSLNAAYRWQKEWYLRSRGLPSERALCDALDTAFYAHERFMTDCGAIGKAFVKDTLVPCILSSGPCIRQALQQMVKHIPSNH